MPAKKPKLPVAVTCQCPISYHVETRRYPNGSTHQVAVWDQEPPSFVEMCFGRCQNCGLPYHTEFTADE